MIPKGTLYIIAAASGTGKTSLASALTARCDNLKISISHTTRPIRANEKDNLHYFFVDLPRFTAMIKAGEFLEHAQVFGHHYGTSRTTIETWLNAGIDVLLDIDWQGARQVRSQIDCTTIFLLPPSTAELRLRLERRKRESAQLIEERLAAANFEIAHYKEFDYVVINDNFEKALTDLESIIHSRRLLRSSQEVRHDRLIGELLHRKSIEVLSETG